MLAVFAAVGLQTLKVISFGAEAQTAQVELTVSTPLAIGVGVAIITSVEVAT